MLMLLNDRLAPGAMVIFDEVCSPSDATSCAQMLRMHAAPAAVTSLVDPCAPSVDSDSTSLMRLCCAAQLVNYPDYRNHEMKALFEWLGRTGRELEVFCIRGPLDGKEYAVELTPEHDLGGFQQSVGFIVVS